jgi:hypothetical protein
VTRRYLRLSWEIETLEYAIEAARMLCDASHYGQFGTAHDASAAPRAASAVLSLAEQRLRLVRGTLRGEVAPDLLAAQHNLLEFDEDKADSDDFDLPLSSGPKL